MRPSGRFGFPAPPASDPSSPWEISDTEAVLTAVEVVNWNFQILALEVILPRPPAQRFCFQSVPFCFLFEQDGINGNGNSNGSNHGAGKNKAPRPAVLLMHGLMQDSESLLCGGRCDFVVHCWLYNDDGAGSLIEQRDMTTTAGARAAQYTSQATVRAKIRGVLRHTISVQTDLQRQP